MVDLILASKRYREMQERLEKFPLPKATPLSFEQLLENTLAAQSQKRIKAINENTLKELMPTISALRP
jgi:hypothetical protein